MIMMCTAICFYIRLYQSFIYASHWAIVLICSMYAVYMHSYIASVNVYHVEDNIIVIPADLEKSIL